MLVFKVLLTHQILHQGIAIRSGVYLAPTLTYALLAESSFLCCVNALRIKKYRVRTIRSAKTNENDSTRIASCCFTYWNKLRNALPTEDKLSEWKFFARQHYQITYMAAKAKVNLGDLPERATSFNKIVVIIICVSELC